MTQAEKIKFRSTKIWKDFRHTQLIKHSFTCQICGIKRKKLLNLHHLNEDNYTDLNENNFALLCPSCHKEVERLIRRKIVDIDVYANQMKEVFIKTKGFKNGG